MARTARGPAATRRTAPDQRVRHVGETPRSCASRCAARQTCRTQGCYEAGPGKAHLQTRTLLCLRQVMAVRHRRLVRRLRRPHSTASVGDLSGALVCGPGSFPAQGTQPCIPPEHSLHRRTQRKPAAGTCQGRCARGQLLVKWRAAMKQQNVAVPESLPQSCRQAAPLPSAGACQLRSFPLVSQRCCQPVPDMCWRRRRNASACART